MDKSEIVKIISAIKVQCPEALSYQNKMEFNLLIDTWFEILKDYPKEVIWVAVRNALKNTVYQKQNWIGAICQEIEKMQTAQEKTDGELWTELTDVLNTVSKIMYFGTAKHWNNGKLIDPTDEVNKIYENLNPILKDYVGGVSGLVALSKAETLEYEKGRFQKAIETLRKRDKTRAEMGAVAGLLGNGVAGFIGENKS